MRDIKSIVLDIVLSQFAIIVMEDFFQVSLFDSPYSRRAYFSRKLENITRRSYSLWDISLRRRTRRITILICFFCTEVFLSYKKYTAKYVTPRIFLFLLVFPFCLLIQTLTPSRFFLIVVLFRTQNILEEKSNHKP